MLSPILSMMSWPKPSPLAKLLALNQPKGSFEHQSAKPKIPLWKKWLGDMITKFNLSWVAVINDANLIDQVQDLLRSAAEDLHAEFLAAMCDWDLKVKITMQGITNDHAQKYA